MKGGSGSSPDITCTCWCSKVVLQGDGWFVCLVRDSVLQWLPEQTILLYLRAIIIRLIHKSPISILPYGNTVEVLSQTFCTEGLRIDYNDM